MTCQLGVEEPERAAATVAASELLELEDFSLPVLLLFPVAVRLLLAELFRR